MEDDLGKKKGRGMERVGLSGAGSGESEINGGRVGFGFRS